MQKKKSIPKKRISNLKREAEFGEKAVEIVKKREIIRAGLIALFLIVAGAGALMIYLNSTEIAEDSPMVLKQLAELNNRIFQRPIDIVAVVNGQTISRKELDERYNLLPEFYRQFISKEDVLSQMVDERLLLQEADRKGIKVSEEEIMEEIAYLMESNGITQEQLDVWLKERNMNMEEFKEYTRSELIIKKLLNHTFERKTEVSYEEVEDYYLSNIESFIVPESINVSHILICHNESVRCVSNLSKEQAEEKAKQIILILNDTNFGEVANRYSDEPAAEFTYGNLGWISARDPSYDAVFMNAALNLSEGQISVPVETIFGFHIIKVFEKRDQEVIEFEEIYEQVKDELTRGKERELFFEFVSSLRNASQIITYEIR